ncbi:MAG: hypothetical protein J6X60_06450 [Ruminiclostridium sp.]|nr:hypothetical protein [Ruminiclostridium sp.]
MDTIDINVINTWLLNWNPSNKVWNWEEQDDEFGYNNTLKTIKSGGTVFFCWKCVSKHIKTGDRIFMVKLGNLPRGIFATGYAASDTYDSTYTIDDGKEATERVVDICITGFLDYHTDDLISQDFLKSKFPDQQWSPQGSGISIKPEAARWLIENWGNFDSKKMKFPQVNSDTEPVIWKISHGTTSTGIPVSLRSVFAQRNVAVVHGSTGALGSQKVSQGDYFQRRLRKVNIFTFEGS